MLFSARPLMDMLHVGLTLGVIREVSTKDLPVDYNRAICKLLGKVNQETWNAWGLGEFAERTMCFSGVRFQQGNEQCLCEYYFTVPFSYQAHEVGRFQDLDCSGRVVAYSATPRSFSPYMTPPAGPSTRTGA